MDSEWKRATQEFSGSDEYILSIDWDGYTGVDIKAQGIQSLNSVHFTAYKLQEKCIWLVGSLFGF